MCEPTVNKVPAPWTPVEFELSGTHAVAKVWGRTYTWDNSLLPTSITTVGKELLAAPAQLHATFNRIMENEQFRVEKKEEPFTKLTYTLLSKEDDKVCFVVGATAGNIILNIRYTVEFDGFVEMSMSVIPFWAYAKNPMDTVPQLIGLNFEIPFCKEYSSLYHYWPNGVSGIIADPNSMGSGAIPEEGISIPFKPYVWSGWEFGGLGIATESDENIQLNPGDPCVTIENKDCCRLLRWNLLNKTPRQWVGRTDRWIETLAPIEYKFALQATPVKELLKDRMANPISFHSIDYEGKCLIPDENGETLLDMYQKAGVKWVQIHEAWSSVQNYGLAANPELLRKIVDACHERGLKIMVYFGYEFSTNAPMWQQERENYLIKTPSGNFVGGWQRLNQCQRDYMVCYAGGYSKVLCDRIRYVYENYDVDGIYTDGTHIPWECANEAHGCGYTDENGVRHTTYPIWALRQHSKDMYAAVHSREGGINMTHQSSCMCAATVGFADYFFNGESIQASLHEGFLEFLNLPAFRTEFMGNNIGIPALVLASQTDDMKIEKYNSLCLIHGVLPDGNVEDTIYLSKFWKEFDNFDFGNATWHPYWIEDRPVKVETENAYCSVYEKDGKYLAAVSSFNENAHEVVLTFDGDVQVEYDVLGENAATADGNKLTVKMDAYKPNLIRLIKK